MAKPVKGHHFQRYKHITRLFRERAEGHEFDFGKGGHLRPLAATCSGGHLRPLVATCSGGHLRPLALAALRPLDWLQVAATGCQ